MGLIVVRVFGTRVFGGLVPLLIAVLPVSCVSWAIGVSLAVASNGRGVPEWCCFVLSTVLVSDLLLTTVSAVECSAVSRRVPLCVLLGVESAVVGFLLIGSFTGWGCGVGEAVAASVFWVFCVCCAGLFVAGDVDG